MSTKETPVVTPEGFYTDGQHVEVVAGWTITVRCYDHKVVSVTGPPGAHARWGGWETQDFEIDKDGDVSIDVHPGERGHGYDGDSAGIRYVPVCVMETAIRVWRVHNPPTPA